MMETSLVLRRRRATEVVDLGVALLRSDAPAWARVYAPWAALAALGALALWVVDPWAAAAWAVVLARLGQAPVTLAVSERVAGRSPVPRWTAQLTAYGRHSFAWIVATGMVIVSSLVFPIALWIWGRALYLPEVVVVERPASGTAGRIAALSGISAENVIGTRAWLLAVEVWAVLAGETIGQLLVDGVLQMGTPFGSLWDGEVTPYMILGFILVQPLLALIRFAAYLDVRTRTEALDAWFAVWAASARPREGG